MSVQAESSAPQPGGQIAAADSGGHALSELALAATVLMWAVNIPFMKSGLAACNPYFFNGARLILSVLVLSGLAVLERRRGVPGIPRHARRSVLIYAVIISVVYQFLFLLGIMQGSSGNTALILSTVPLWTALFARVFLGERLSQLSWIGLLTAFAGTCIVSLSGAGKTAASPEANIWGNVFTLCAALAWSTGTVYSRPLMRHVSPTQLSACSAAIGLPFHLCIAAPFLSEGLSQLARPLVTWSALYSGIFSTGVALALWNFGVRHAGAAHAAVWQNVVPVVAIGTAWYFRDEPVTPAQMVGGTLIIGGLIIMRRGRRHAV